MKRNILRLIAVLIVTLGGLSSCSSTSVDDSTASSVTKENLPSKITFFSLNDTHGAIEEDTSSSSSYHPGMAKLFTDIKNDSDYDSNSVLLSSGDMYQGSALSNISEGLCMTECMNKMGFEAMAIGNHEFDWGADKLEACEKKATFPFLGINIYSKSTGKIVDFAEPSTTFTRGGAKIGVVGSILSSISSSISAKQITDIDFKADTNLVINEAKRLKQEEGCDIVIWSTHQGFNSVGRSILSSSYVDGAFGGHDHAFTNESVGNKYFIEGGSSGMGYSKLTFTLSNNSYSPSSGSFTKIKKIASVKGDEGVASVVSSYQETISPLINKEVGERDGVFTRYSKSYTTGSLGTLCTNAMLYYANEVCNDDTVVAAFHNVKGVRADWEGTKDESTNLYSITIGDLYSAFPFDNELQVISVSGDVLKSGFNNMSGYYSSSSLVKDGNNLYIKSSTGERTLVEDNKDYRIISIDYVITSQGLFYNNGEDGERLNGEIAYERDAISYYLTDKKTINVADYPFQSDF